MRCWASWIGTTLSLPLIDLRLHRTAPFAGVLSFLLVQASKGEFASAGEIWECAENSAKFLCGIACADLCCGIAYCTLNKYNIV